MTLYPPFVAPEARWLQVPVVAGQFLSGYSEGNNRAGEAFSNEPSIGYYPLWSLGDSSPKELDL